MIVYKDVRQIDADTFESAFIEYKGNDPRYAPCLTYRIGERTEAPKDTVGIVVSKGIGPVMHHYSAEGNILSRLKCKSHGRVFQLYENDLTFDYTINSDGNAIRVSYREKRHHKGVPLYNTFCCSAVTPISIEKQ